MVKIQQLDRSSYLLTLISLTFISLIKYVIQSPSEDIFVRLLGDVSCGLFIAHLFAKYSDISLVRKSPTLWMVLVGTISIVMNWVLIFLIVVIAIFVGNIRNKHKQNDK